VASQRAASHGLASHHTFALARLTASCVPPHLSHSYRDRSLLHVQPSELLALLRPALTIAAAGCRDQPKCTARRSPTHCRPWRVAVARRTKGAAKSRTREPRASRPPMPRAAQTDTVAVCTRTFPGRNPFGKSCADYATPVPPSPQGSAESLAGGWCQAGGLKPGAQWAGGEAHGWPEKHCCACGRANWSRSAAPL
jgi:hypothetical protein